MQQISIDANPRQMRKLLRGEKVRVRHGEGFNVLVHPETYNIVARAFNKKKGAQMGLSEEELIANANITSGIQNVKQNNLIPLFDDNGNLLPPAQQVVPPPNYGPAPPQVRGGNPGIIGQGIGGAIGHSGIRHSHKANNMAQQVEQIKHYGDMNAHLGTNFDYMGHAGYAKAVADKLSAQIAEQGFKQKYPKVEGSGFSTAVMPDRVQHFGVRKEPNITGRGVGVHRSAPPALESQPYNENFQMQHFLPPAFQHHDHIHGSGINPANPPYYQSQAESANFIRQSVKDTNGEIAKLQKHKKGQGLYAGGTSGGGLYAGGGLGP